MRNLFVINLAVKSFSMLFGFAFSYFLASLWGASALGFYVLYMMIVNLLLVTVKLGQDRHVLKSVAVSSTSRPLITFNAMTIVIIMSVIVTGVSSLTFMLNIFKPPQNVSSFFFISSLFLSLVGGGGIAVVVATLKGSNRVTNANFLDGVPLNFCLFVTVGLGYILGMKENAESVILVHGALSIVLSLILLKAFSFFKLKQSTFRWPTFRSQVILGVPFALTSGMSILNNSIDTMFLSHYLTLDKVAHYNIALKLSTIIHFPVVIISSIIANRFAQLFASKLKNELKTLLFKVIRIVSISGLFLFTVILTFSEYILPIWGESFKSAENALVILSVGQLVNVLVGSIGVMLMMTGFEKHVLASTVVLLLFNTVANFFLIPAFGIEGAAIATACSIILQNLMFIMILVNNRLTLLKS